MVHISLSLFRRPGRLRAVVGASALACTLMLGGCASVPPPNDAMNLAQVQLQGARDAGAGDYDPVDLGFAQDKFQQAQAMMAERKYDKAADLAAESRADSELAAAKARLGAARAKIQSQMAENARLRREGEQAAAAAAAEFAKPMPVPATAGSAAAPPDGSVAPPPTDALPDMPAPSSSVLSAPVPGQGFQSTPTQGNPSQDGHDASQGFQPTGGQP